MRLSLPLNDAVAEHTTATVTAGELAVVIEFATASNPRVGSDEAAAASPELLEVLTGGEPDRGLDTGAEFLATVSEALGQRCAELEAAGEQDGHVSRAVDASLSSASRLVPGPASEHPSDLFQCVQVLERVPLDNEDVGGQTRP